MMFLSKICEIYYLFYSDEHKLRHKVSTKCPKKSDALLFLQQFKQSEHERKQKLKTILLSAFVKEYSEYASSILTAKSFRTYQTAFKELLRVEGDKPLQAFGIREIEHFLSVKKVEASEWSARKYYISLASTFQKAVQWGFITSNPFRKVPIPKVKEILPAYFTECDFRLFLSVVEDKDFRELCITGLLTGLRLGELISLRWKDLDFTTRVIMVRNTENFTTKTRKNRVVPMSDELYDLLKKRKETLRYECETVFYDGRGNPLKEETITHKFKKYIRRGGLNDKLHFHSLRHSFASALVSSGVSLYAVQKLLGHSSSKTTEIYSHLMPQQLHFEVNKGLHAMESSLINSSENK